jgi:hypothetical protein
VHPRTLGEIRVLTLGRRWPVADLIAPVLPGIRLRARFRQE